jgi:rSAM/selenodomain-associated transferase 1
VIGVGLMVKWPQVGVTKSRLASGINPAVAARLYQAFVEDELEMLQESGLPLEIWFWPPENQALFTEWLGHCSYLPQIGSDLGDRLCYGIRTAFQRGYQGMIALASDCPDFPVSLLRQAVEGLRTHDAVIVPSYDGGYNLIGFRRSGFLPEAFAGIPWSTAEVMERTQARILEKGRTLLALDPWPDIDTVLDLQELWRRSKGEQSSLRSRTAALMGTDFRIDLRSIRTGGQICPHH